MITAPLPDNEPERLRALQETTLLDSLPEQEYDDLVKIAAQICGMPTALISLVDHDRQWFKARLGLDAEQTPRDVAFCSHAILQDEPLVVSNALADERFHDNPLVASQPRIRAYAGAPLVVADGLRLGTLCVIDYKPHALSEGQISSLQALARQVCELIRLRRQTQLLSERSASLLASNRELEQFSYAVSHDLREPLRTISGFARLLNRRESAGLSESGQEYLDLILGGVRRMDAMIDGMLNMGRLTRADIDCRSVSLGSVFDAAESNIEATIQAAGAHIDHGELGQVQGNPELLVQLMQNLLANGIKYAKPGESPRVRVVSKPVGELTVIEIADNGRGIPADQQPQMFQLFRRGTHTEDVAGYGIGLALCQRIVDRHHGQIEFDSQEGEGTTVRVALPAAA